MKEMNFQKLTKRDTFPPRRMTTQKDSKSKEQSSARKRQGTRPKRAVNALEWEQQDEGSSPRAHFDDDTQGSDFEEDNPDFEPEEEPQEEGIPDEEEKISRLVDEHYMNALEKNPKYPLNQCDRCGRKHGPVCVVYTKASKRPCRVCKDKGKALYHADEDCVEYLRFMERVERTVKNIIRENTQMKELIAKMKGNICPPTPTKPKPSPRTPTKGKTTPKAPRKQMAKKPEAPKQKETLFTSKPKPNVSAARAGLSSDTGHETGHETAADEDSTEGDLYDITRFDDEIPVVD